MCPQQLFQDLKKGATFLEQVPLPSYGRNDVVIESRASLISLGTEKMLLSFGRASLLEKALSQPEKVKMVLDKVRTDGLWSTWESVQAKLSDPIGLGYCNAGVVIACGSAVEEFKVGDRVVSNAPHAEIAVVGRNLVAKIPDSITFEEASFTVLASIGLNGVRVLDVTLGERVAVVGLGLLGQITLDLLRASGVRAIGFDLEGSKIELAQKRGFEAHSVTSGTQPFLNRFDGAVITASAKGNAPLEFAAEIVRKRGRISAVGSFEISVARKPFYDKELEFRMATSYGPGRYDPAYEQKGQDYPLPYVRWTENRNFQAILDLLEQGKIQFKDLISRRYPFEKAPDAYDSLLNDAATLGVLLEYGEKESIDFATSPLKTLELNATPRTSQTGLKKTALIGAGNFSKVIILPTLKRLGISLETVVSSKGSSGALSAKRFGARKTTTDSDSVFKDPEIKTVVIATPHGSHAKLVCSALDAGKNVFVEKPLAVSLPELRDVIQAWEKARVKLGRTPQLLVGFNRRFSPLTQVLKKSFPDGAFPLSMNMIVNAGFIPEESWVHDPETGGGRIIGEGCHFVDLMAAVSGSTVKSVSSSRVRAGNTSDIRADDVLIQLEFANGSVGTLQYSSQGRKDYPKERLIVFGGGKVAELDNFKKVKGYGAASKKLWNQDKGHAEEFRLFFEAVQNDRAPLISFESIVNTTLATLAHVRSLQENRKVSISELENELAHASS